MRTVRMTVGAMALGIVALSGVNALADNYYWDNGAGDNNFTNAMNWVGDTLPTNSARNYLLVDKDGADKAVLSGGELPNFAALNIGYSGGGNGEFEQTGGVLKANQNASDVSRIGTGGFSGLWRMTGGLADINAIQIALGSTLGTTGTISIAGGDFVIGRARYDYSLHIAGNANVAGLFEISGGSFKSRAGVHLNTGGTFSVIGADATEIGVGSQNSVDGRWIHEAGGTLKARIAADGITPILVDDVDESDDWKGDVWFADGALLDVGFVDGHVETGTWAILEYEGALVNLGLQFAEGVDTNMWDFGVTNSQLVVSYGEDAPDMPGVTTPLAPSGLYALPDAPDIVTVRWDASAQATLGYNVYRSLDDVFYTKIAADVVENSYEDSVVTNGMTYYYKVSGINDKGEGDLSEPDPAKPTPYLIIGTDGTYKNSPHLTKHQLFDGDIDTYFDSSDSGTSWAGLDFGAGNAQQIYEIHFVIRGGWGSAYERSEGAYFEGANTDDFSDAVILHTVSTNAANYPSVNTVTLSNETPFRYVRLHAPPTWPLYSFAEVGYTLGSDFTGQGTSIPWLESFGLSEADEYVDNDADGLLTWEEYVAGTNPTNGASVLVVNSVSSVGGDIVITWQSVEGKNYSIVTNTSLTVASPGIEASGIPGLSNETSYTGTISGADNVFYEVGVE